LPSDAGQGTAGLSTEQGWGYGRTNPDPPGPKQRGVLWRPPVFPTLGAAALSRPVGVLLCQTRRVERAAHLAHAGRLHADIAGAAGVPGLRTPHRHALHTLSVAIVPRQRGRAHPEVARDALLATHGGLSLERCAVIGHLSPMALYRLVCALGHQSLVTVLTQCGLSLPTYCLADEKHSHCLTAKVYLPTIVSDRVIWHLGYTEHASAVAFAESYGVFQRAALQQEPAYRVRGILKDGFDSTTKRIGTLDTATAGRSTGQTRGCGIDLSRNGSPDAKKTP